MSGPSKKPKSAGERAEFLETLAVIAAVAVVTGLLIESGPELGRAAVKGVLPSREVQGNVLVTLGVAAETFLGWRALKWARKSELEAEERIALAEKTAAEANLERARLEHTFRRRSVSRLLTDEERKFIVQELGRFRGQGFTLRLSNSPLFSTDNTTGTDWEQQAFALQLLSTLEQSGWVHENIANHPSPTVAKGLKLFIAYRGGASSAAAALGIALAKFEIFCQQVGTNEMSRPLVIGVGLL